MNNIRNFGEEVDMLQVYFECRKNSVAALRLYQERFPNRIFPNRRKFMKLEQNLRNHGTLKNTKRNENRAFDEDKELDVLLSVQENPRTSVRELAQIHDMTCYTVHKILKKSKLFPYKTNLVQNLHQNDFENRIQFCQWYLNNINVDANFSHTILWTDESNFSNNGMFNRNTSYYWSETNPRITRERNFQKRFSVNVWCGMLGSKIFGPYFYNGTLTGERYNEFLRTNLQEYLENLTVREYAAVIFQQDGAPAHNAQINLNYLNQCFGNQWIATRGPIRWPARSPDLSPLDFFLWGYVKNKVFLNPPIDLDDLKYKIRQAIANISNSTKVSVIRSIMDRCQLCIEKNGQQFEQFL